MYLNMPHLDRAIEANMRVVLLVVFCCVVSIQITQSQRRRYAAHNPLRMRHIATLRTAQANYPIHFGPIHFHGVIGKLPVKYVPLTPADEYATQQAKSVVSTIVTFIPAVFTVKQLGPLNVDLPEFWLRGKLYLNNLVTRGINQVKLLQLEIRTRNDRVDFSIHAPRISADVNFDFEGYLGMVPLYLTGSVSLKAQDLDPSGAVGAKKVSLPVVGEVYQVESADVSVDVRSLAVGANDPNADQKMFNININNGINSNLEIDADVIKLQVMEHIKDQLADIILSGAIKEINNELAKVPAAAVDRFLSQKSY